MIKTYKVGGMNCDHCKATVEKALLAIEGVKTVSIILKDSEVILELERQIPIIELQEALSEAGLFFILERDEIEQSENNSLPQKKKSRYFKKFLKRF